MAGRGFWQRRACLKAKRATIHYDEIEAFSEAFPQVDIVRQRWVDDGDRLTASGAVTAFELMMHLIAQSPRHRPNSQNCGAFFRPRRHHARARLSPLAGIAAFAALWPKWKQTSKRPYRFPTSQARWMHATRPGTPVCKGLRRAAAQGLPTHPP